MGQYKGRILSNEKITDTVWKLSVEVHAEQNFSYEAGQFLIVELPKPEGQVADAQAKPQRGYYSIASAPDEEGIFDLLVEHGPQSGEVSQWMTQLRPKDKVKLEGPMGKLSLGMPQKRTQLFLGFRAGVAPLRALIQQALKKKSEHPIYLFLGGQGLDDLLLDAEWRELSRENSRFHYVPSADPAATLLAEIPGRMGMDIYMAGFKRELEPMKDVLLQAGFPKIDIRAENYG